MNACIEERLLDAQLYLLIYHRGRRQTMNRLASSAWERARRLRRDDIADAIMEHARARRKRQGS